jgi:carbonic anhydrase/acetyltransferase-like protein (isoleucine patch superfamily)
MFINSFVDPTSEIAGNVSMGEKNYIGPFAMVEARDAFHVIFSGQDNLQDNALISATTQDVTLGVRTSIAHGARVVDSIIGNFVFVGFNSVVENSVLEDGVIIQHGARVIGVRIPKDRIVPPGATITSDAQVGSLQPIVTENIKFKDEVVSVNNEFASAYGQMAAELGEKSVRGAGPKPRTSWDADYTKPQFGKDVILAEKARIIGNVQLGGGSSVGTMVSIRGDEGAPIVIGRWAAIGDQVTFHALLGQTIRIGDHLVTGKGVVFHGGLEVGDRVRVDDGAVLFHANLGSRITVGKGAIVIGVRLADGSQVPEYARVLDQATADQLAPV